LTLLGARPGDDFVVVEVGTNHPGEIDNLGKIVQPDAAVFTSVGQEHMEFFKTLENVAKEEASIFAHTRRQDGLIAIHADAWRFLPETMRPVDGQGGRKVVRYGKAGDPDADLTYSIISADAKGMRFKVAGSAGAASEIFLPMIGEHNAGNTLAAIAVARWMGLSDEQAAASLSKAKPVEMRLNVVTLGGGAGADEPGVLLINDAYNANPSSVEAAISTLAMLTPPGAGGRRIAVLGDMLELGEHGPDLHRQVGRFAAQHGKLDAIVLIGKLSMFTAEAVAKISPEKINVFPVWEESLPAKVAGLIKPGDAVLIKASRGSKLERVIPAIQQRFAPGKTGA
jgi:UDP-N-acetylmuramoyl-tripeptide--D-alanyl-D-alanine ligase